MSNMLYARRLIYEGRSGLRHYDDNVELTKNGAPQVNWLTNGTVVQPDGFNGDEWDIFGPNNFNDLQIDIREVTLGNTAGSVSNLTLGLQAYYNNGIFATIPTPNGATNVNPHPCQAIPQTTSQKLVLTGTTTNPTTAGNYISYSTTPVQNGRPVWVSTIISPPQYVWWDGSANWNITTTTPGTLPSNGTSYFQRTNDLLSGAYALVVNGGSGTGSSTITQTPLIVTISVFDSWNVTHEMSAFNGVMRILVSYTASTRYASSGINGYSLYAHMRT